MEEEGRTERGRAKEPSREEKRGEEGGVAERMGDKGMRKNGEERK